MFKLFVLSFFKNVFALLIIFFFLVLVCVLFGGCASGDKWIVISDPNTGFAVCTIHGNVGQNLKDVNDVFFEDLVQYQSREVTVTWSTQYSAKSSVVNVEATQAALNTFVSVIEKLVTGGILLSSNAQDLPAFGSRSVSCKEIKEALDLTDRSAEEKEMVLAFIVSKLNLSCK